MSYKKIIDKHNNVTNPEHYTQGEIECLKAIRSAEGVNGFVHYCKGNVYKYLWRSKHKHKDNKNGELEDLKKALVYLEKAIQTLEGEY